MASAPSDLGPVSGRVDREGRLVDADPPLLRLQEEAGSSLGAPIALPQLAAIVRSAIKLGVPLSRAVIAASSEEDLDLWVRAEPDAEGATLVIEGWKARPQAPPRLTLVASEADSGLEDAAPAPRLTTDAELRITHLDAELAGRLGVEAESVIGNQLTRHFLIEPDVDGGMPLLAALASRQPFTGQHARVRGDGETSLALAGRPVHSPDGAFSGYEIEVIGDDHQGLGAGLMFDPALDAALRSPLDRIIAAAERIVDRSEGPLRSDYAAYAGDIAAAGRHLLSVIRSMTEQSASEGAGHVDIADAAREALHLTEVQAQERSIHVELVGASEPLAASGDPRGVVQILVNLVGNALRHSPDGGTVAVIAERRGDQVAIVVADEGPGIAEGDQQRIFERYERVSDEPGGIGLGLAISRRLARSMGGDIELESAAGEGARFALVLPAA
ncbi:MAG: HAMP domain-containing histidine kinase [Sphingomonas sp.]|nr:HAMP domain-containing histidine kinase [Sphingomonas sp.]